MARIDENTVESVNQLASSDACLLWGRHFCSFLCTVLFSGRPGYPISLRHPISHSIMAYLAP